MRKKQTGGNGNKISKADDIVRVFPKDEIEFIDWCQTNYTGERVSVKVPKYHVQPIAQPGMGVEFYADGEGGYGEIIACLEELAIIVSTKGATYAVPWRGVTLMMPKPDPAFLLK